MADRRFRFGVVAGQAGTPGEWIGMARRAEQFGYDTFLIPDTRHTLAPFPALAAVAASTSTLRVGTYVLSVANRTPAAVAWESQTLAFLSGNRFELGVGAGRPDAEQDAAVLGVPYGDVATRVARVVETIGAAREKGVPILVAASRPRMLALAAEHADTVALGLPPSATEDGLGATVTRLRDVAGDRFDDLELHLNTAAVAASAADVPAWVSRMVGGDPQAMAAAGGIGFLLGTPTEIAGTLRRRRDELGISYVAVSAAFMDGLAPVAERLAGTT
ncbi:MAG TPA: LLM class flavin-dependent oxidoreductase [Micromonosporaceae bacterium]|jgi:alkanesulfonate monooxygenase SsuD/methylene tetrahydromethanopterin reductase-like flavin-dependent oxidoreductase (luciferase family)